MVVDDHPAIRTGVRTLLNLAEGVEVVGDARTSEEGIALSAELEPDVVIMDLRLPTLGGIETTRAITTANPKIRVLVLTMLDDDASIFAAIRAGARGYLLKESEQEDFVRAVYAVAHGDFITSPAIASRVITFFASGGGAGQPSFPGLSEREREVLDLIAAGHNNQGIAHKLFLSPKTVRNYVSSIFAKLQVADRAGAIVKARQAGLGGARPDR
ncbi:response regulator [Cellulomonas dongxiuzhuiae]|uniref:response regulator n=1 Tax=Cellulomonas dongxiuzhuiae TaxID=2819979 RepID=UPI001FBB649E|nr:response regulator transcription factor [Cellulomonas dongxiuzhuiae]